MGFIIRIGKTFKSVETLKALFTTLIRPILEYADVKWFPDGITLSNALESCQRKQLKYLEFKATGRYPDRGTNTLYLCSKFNLDLLANRKKFHQIAYMLEILRNIVDSPYLLENSPLCIPRLASRQPVTLYVGPTRRPTIYNSQLYRMKLTTNNFLRNTYHETDLFCDSIKDLLIHAYIFATQSDA